MTAEPDLSAAIEALGAEFTRGAREHVAHDHREHVPGCHRCEIGRDEAAIDIHTWFGLTYANYLVVPRSVLQSMPEEWQHRFTALLAEMEDNFSHLDWPAYEVRVLKRDAEVITPM